jgi:hypothetical protein
MNSVSGDGEEARLRGNFRRCGASSNFMTPRRAVADFVAPVLIAAIIGAVAAFGVWAQEPWLAPSLGSAVFTQLLHPEAASAKPFAILVGQVLGAAAGFAGVFLAGAGSLPPFMGGHRLLPARVSAIAMTSFLAAILQLASGALTPAGGATALVVAMGAEADNWTGAMHLAVGLLLVTALGEPARRLVLRLRAL